jgi:SAM-dependent methyltransferase
MKSVSFDRAADVYDETRGFPPGVGELVADAAIEMLPPGARVLEVGVGTGRIARPLLGRGMDITGLDLSRRMMDRLLEALPPGAPRPPLAEADATQLPLRAEVFDAVLSVHVFHLIANWRKALAEVRRVLKPEGVFLTGYDWRPADSPGDRIREKWRALIRARGVHNQPGAHDFADVGAALRASGAMVDERSAGEWSRTRPIAQHIETIEHRTWSSSWDVPDDFFSECLAELRTWAVSEYGSLEREFTVPHKFIWQRYHWGG